MTREPEYGPEYDAWSASFDRALQNLKEQALKKPGGDDAFERDFYRLLDAESKYFRKKIDFIQQYCEANREARTEFYRLLEEELRFL